MLSLLYKTIIFNPLYNGLIFLMVLFPWMDAGVAVIIFTILIRLILFPLSKKAVVTQVRMKELQPALEKIKQESKGNKQEEALKTMALYKEKKVSPFSSFLVLLIQLPIIYSLYYIFIRSGLPTVDTTLIYPFIKANIPHVNMHFLGLIDIGTKSILMAVIAAIAQFLQLHFSIAASGSSAPTGGAADMAQNMTKSMKYIFPIIVFYISYNISAVVALYWTVTSLFTLGQELVVRRHLKRHEPI